MNEYYITFRSITYAQRGERVVNGAGVTCNLQRTPRWMEERGCGYCLRVRTDEIGKLLKKLSQEEVTWRRCYARSPGGKYEEVSL